jgi:dihydrofolate synthase/folylpolyglutamate synthase
MTIATRDQVDDYLCHLILFGIKLGLDTSRDLLARLGNPQDRFSALHVAGSNGKGSTVVMLDALLSAYGLTVGRYTSPHLEDFSERICVAGSPISDEDLIRHGAQLAKVSEGKEPPPTFFEAGTALAFLQFADGPARRPVDVAVVEVGLGGRLDATNVLNPTVCVITNVTLEHTAHLGTTIEQVATEKAGIIKPGVPVVTAAKGVALAVIRERAAHVGAPLYVLGEDFNITHGERFSYHGIRTNYHGLVLGLKGAHQRTNAALALAALELYFPAGVAVAGERVAKALADVSWPGRLETVADNPTTVLDCAHNPAGAEVLAQYLAGKPYSGPLHLVLGVLEDKPFDDIFTRLGPLAVQVVLTAPNSDRAPDLSAQAAMAGRLHRNVRVEADVGQALAVARAAALEDGGWVCVAGSVFTVGEARAALADDVFRSRT